MSKTESPTVRFAIRVVTACSLLLLPLAGAIAGQLTKPHHAQAAYSITLAADPASAPLSGDSEEPDAPLGSAITYQGQLQQGGSPANGHYDFLFRLFDASTGGNEVGTFNAFINRTVTDGLFTVTLNFGVGAFNGEARWIEIGVRPNGGGTYTTLSPRQPVTPAPYALFALKTEGYGNVLVVSPSGGDDTSIQTALDSITDASDANRYLVWVGPGVYTETVTMKPYVDIEGAGEKATIISQVGNASLSTGTVIGASNAELRSLTVRNTGGNTYATAIYNDGVDASMSILHVTVVASGGDHNWGVSNRYSSSPTMSNMTILAHDGPDNRGVSNYFSSSPTMRNVTITASGNSGNNYGVYNSSSTATIEGSAITAQGGNSNFGIYNLAAAGNYTVTVNNSQIAASSRTIGNDVEFTTLVASSQLSGGPASALGVTCANVHDESYTAYTSTCP
jgi:hypothetical protein